MKRSFKPKQPKLAVDAIPMKNREIDNKIRGLKSMMLNKNKAFLPKRNTMTGKLFTQKAKQIKKLPKVRKLKKFKGKKP